MSQEFIYQHQYTLEFVLQSEKLKEINEVLSQLEDFCRFTDDKCEEGFSEVYFMVNVSISKKEVGKR